MAGLFYHLKMRGYNAEMAPEYAKEKVYDGDRSTLTNQLYVTAKQYNRIKRLEGKVDIVITDSPLVLGIVYGGHGCNNLFRPFIVELFHEFNFLNIILERDPVSHPYTQHGRSQTKDESLNKDKEIRQILDDHSIPYHVVKVAEQKTLDDMMELIIRRLNDEN